VRKINKLQTERRLLNQNTQPLHEHRIRKLLTLHLSAG